MVVVQKKRRAPLALMSLAGALTALGAMSLLSRHTVAPGCPPTGNGPRVTPFVREKTVEVSRSPTLASRAPAQKEGKLAAHVSTSVSIGLGDLIIPVVGVQPRQLRDTFTERRSAGRLHQALDIPAAHGTPVLAAASGRIRKLSSNTRGGISLYQVSCDGMMMYYYAHLDRYADGLAEGQEVHRGNVIGYVGATGNAGAGNDHLHFAMWIVTDPRQYWRGINVNPYSFLQAAS